MNKLLNEAGFSIPNVIITTGLMGLVALGSVRITENLNRFSKYVQTDIEATQYYAQSVQMLRDSQACLQTFGNLSIPQLDERVEYTASVKDADGRDFISQGEQYGTVKFLGMQVINDNLDFNTNKGTLSVLMQFERDQKGSTGTKIISKKSILNVERNPASGQVEKCYDSTEAIIQTTLEQSCTSFGGQWNSNTQTCDNIFDSVAIRRDMCTALGFQWDPNALDCVKHVRGGLYGSCTQVKDSNFVITNNNNNVPNRFTSWPVIDCVPPNTLNNQPLCANGYRPALLSTNQFLTHSIPGDTSSPMTIASYHVSWACTKL